MPWKAADAEKHIKGLSDVQASAWAKTANAVRKSCIAAGGTAEMCDARAIATANKAAKSVKENAVTNLTMELAELGQLANLEEAAWTAAMINDLPDSSFLHIEPGAEKDEDGKTKPRSKRHFPVMDSDGKVDLPHLRNALARIPQSKLDQGAKDKALKAAQKLAKKHLPSYQESDHRTLQEVEGLSFDEVRELIRHALRERLGLSGNNIGGPWVTDVYDDYFIYENSDRYFQAPYIISAGAAAIGEPIEVERKTVYEPLKQEAAAELVGDLNPLVETLELQEVEPLVGANS